jgi:predicted acylesterase/phospholipase RssA
MGITIIQKSDLSVRKRDAKIALVLAGGALTGGAFKLGGLKALDDFLINRKVTDFDIYVGLSAGALLGAPLAAGVSPSEMLRALDGTSVQFSRFRPNDFYHLNSEELLKKPVEYLLDVMTYVPGILLDLAAEMPELLDRIAPAAKVLRKAPSFGALQDVAAPIVSALLARRLPMPHYYLPSGMFDNVTIERYLRRNLESNGLPNDFRSFQRHTDKDLYITAMNLDTAERVVFGHDEDSSLTVSEAVQASTALPGFYKPARLNGTDYVDGGVRRTASIDVAIEHDADLIICYNPFRPFSNRVTHRYDSRTGKFVTEGTPLADQGIFTILNQVFRTLLHSRLQYGLRQYQDDPNFTGDIIVIEPTETDTHVFGMNPVAFWEGPRAGRYGYVSVTQSIETHYDVVKQILQSYGLLMTRREVREGLEKMQKFSLTDENDSGVLTRDVPRRDLDVA